ncbi:dynein regulatory complex protein 12 [Morphnus guianensis]
MKVRAEVGGSSGTDAGPHTLVLLGEARKAYPTSPFGLPLAQPQITLLLASPAPSHAKALDMDSLHPRCLYLVQAEETTEAEASLPAKVIALPFPLVLKNRLILAESQHRDHLLVPPIVTTFVPFSLPWLPQTTRQYQELQKQTAAHSQHLEAKVKSLQEQLTTGLRESLQTQETAIQALAERDRTIAQLQSRLDAMEREYEKILHGSLDLVLAKMAEASQHWEEVGTTIAMEHKECLQEFGLGPLEL